MDTNIEPHKCIILVQPKKIGTHENKAIHGIQISLNAIHITYIHTDKS